MEKRTKNHRLRLALESWWLGKLLLAAPAKVGCNGERRDWWAIASQLKYVGVNFDKLSKFVKVYYCNKKMIKNMKAIVGLLVGTVLLAACNTTSEKKEEHQHRHAVQQETKQENNVKPSNNQVSLKDGELNLVYQQYLLLNKALVNSDMAGAKEAGMAIELGAKALNNGAKLANLAAKITAAANIEAQRTLFSDLSNEMVTKVKATGIQSGEVYVEYCPMALNDKGASWLSNQKEIKNPYYGASMLECGEVKETLK